MRFPDLVIATVVGGGREEYDFLFGSLDYHRQLAGILVWETGASRWAGGWPEGVLSVHRPIYGGGPDAFDYGRALDDATAWAVANTQAAVFARVDADEYLPRNFELAVAAARGGLAARVGMIHHLNPYWAARVDSHSRVAVWPLRGQGGAPLMRHVPSDMGGFHPMPVGPAELHLPEVRLQHLRFAIGRKAAEMPTYWINEGWYRARIEDVRSPWPAPFVRWRDESRRPTEVALEERV